MSDDRNKDIATNIKKYIKLKGITQKELADKIDISPSTLSDYLNLRSNPSHGVIQKIADYFGIYKSDIDTSYKEQIQNGIVSIYEQLEKTRQQKVYSYAEHELEEQRYLEEQHEEYHGQTAAGAPIEGQQPIPFVGATTVNLLVNGDSMEPDFYDGGIIKYHPQPELENGEIGVFAVNGGITLKRFRKNGDIRLESLNKKYEDIVIKETDDFNILGKVIL